MDFYCGNCFLGSHPYFELKKQIDEATNGGLGHLYPILSKELNILLLIEIYCHIKDLF
jgi:hypothetical protein